MVLIYQSHELFEPVLRLKSLLLGLAIFVSLLVCNCLLGFVAFLELLSLDLRCDQVLMHPIDHMLVTPLHHQLVVMGLLDIFKPAPGYMEPIGLPHVLLFDVALFCLVLLEFFLLQESQKARWLTLSMSSSLSLAMTSLWMLSYFSLTLRRVPLTSFFSSSPNSHEGITLFGSSRVLLGMKVLPMLSSSLWVVKLDLVI